MERGWTAEVAEDLLALARLAALAPITPHELALAGYPSEEDVQEDADLWDADTRPLYGSQWSSTPAGSPPPVLAVERSLAGSWPALKASVIGWLRRWPSNAPLLGAS